MYTRTARMVGQAVGALGMLTMGLGVAQADENRESGLHTVGMPAIEVGMLAVETPAPTVPVPSSDVWSEVVVLEARPLDGARPSPGDFDRSAFPGGRDRLLCILGIDDPARIKTRAVPRRMYRQPG